jgi:hypothetical protein
VTPIVLTMRPAASKDWSRYFRLVLIEESPNETLSVHGHCTTLKCNWRPWLQFKERGDWAYRGDFGAILAINYCEEGSDSLQTIVLEKVHWNFRHLCTHTELAGSGSLNPDHSRVIWVMGSGAKVPVNQSGTDAHLNDTHCKQNYRQTKPSLNDIVRQAYGYHNWW